MIKLNDMISSTVNVIAQPGQSVSVDRLIFEQHLSIRVIKREFGVNNSNYYVYNDTQTRDADYERIGKIIMSNKAELENDTK